MIQRNGRGGGHAGSSRRSDRGAYPTLLFVHDVADGRGQEALAGFYQDLTPEQLEATEAVAMDMWKPYIQATQARLPGWAEKVCFDRFHVAKHLGIAVYEVRKAEHRALLADGDARL